MANLGIPGPKPPDASESGTQHLPFSKSCLPQRNNILCFETPFNVAHPT